MNPVTGVCQLLPSLMAFDPQSLGLPAFEDLVHGVVPMDAPLHIRGTVVKGFGRGSKVWMREGSSMHMEGQCALP